MSATPSLHHELSGLAAGLESLDMRAAALFAEDVVAERDRLTRTLRSYLIPRLEEPERPLTVVITGPTGSGKSTILNSLLGLDLAETGALRPTTRTPLAVTTAEHADRFHRLGGVDCHVTTARTPVLTRMALVDTPDIDSTSLDHRAMAESLIDVGDAVIYVTSALRYADLVPWEVLRRAANRGAPVIYVLNRLSAGSAGAAIDYGSRLARAGIETDIVRITEQRSANRAHIPPAAVRELSRQLYAVADVMEGGGVGTSVATRVFRDISGLAEALSGLSRLISHRHDAIEAEVGSRRSDLRLEGILADVPTPSSGGRIRRLLRLRARGLADAELERWLDLVAARLRSRVATELRATARRLDEVLPFPVGDAVIEPALVSMATAVHGWVAHLRRVTDGVARRDRNRATASLARRALGAAEEKRDPDLGTGAETLAAGVLADLETRLTVPFSQMAMLASAILEARAPEPDPGDLGDLVRRANARLTFVDA